MAPRKTIERKTTEPKTTERRLGRPPDTDSGETRDRIVSIARERFAELGFEMATNREIANRSGVTPAALYHYFGSKLDLYLAVHEHTQDLVYSRFENCVRGHDTFVAQFSAILDEAHDMNRVDHSVPGSSARCGWTSSGIRRCGCRSSPVAVSASHSSPESSTSVSPPVRYTPSDGPRSWRTS